MLGGQEAQADVSATIRITSYDNAVESLPDEPEAKIITDKRLLIAGGGLGKGQWFPEQRSIGDDIFMPISVTSDALGRFLAGKATRQFGDGRQERVLSHVGVLIRLRDARNAVVRGACDKIAKEFAEAGAKTSGREQAQASKKTVSRRPEWRVVPEVYRVAVRLAHKETHLECKVLKGRPNDAVWINVSIPVLEQLREEVQFVLNRLDASACQEQPPVATPPRRKRSLESLPTGSSTRSSESLPSGSSPPSSGPCGSVGQSPPAGKAGHAAVTWREGRQAFLARWWNGSRLQYKTFPLQVEGAAEAQEKNEVAMQAKSFIEANHVARAKKKGKAKARGRGGKRRPLMRRGSGASGPPPSPPDSLGAAPF